MSGENLVKKPKKDVNDFDDDEVEDINLDDDISTSSAKYSEVSPKKRMIRFMALVVAFIFALLLILWIASLLGGGGKRYTYEDVESVMKQASVAYFASHPEYLPKQEGDIVEVGVVNLIAEGYMKDITKYISDDTCTGTVQVEKIGSDYIHTPYLTCGTNYTTVELYRKVLEDNPTTTQGPGLYSFNNSYVFRGEDVNNYVQLDNALWRIVKVTPEGNLALILADGIIYSKPWDNRFNEEKNYESGLNNYNVSRVKEYLSLVYTGNVEFDEEKILSDKDRTRITPFDVCVGKRSLESESKNNSEECRQKATAQKLGLLTLSEYLYASLDSNCRSANTKSCTNYNYLAIDNEWWLATAFSGNDYEVFKVDQWGIVTLETAGTYSTVRPVIYLKSSVMLKEGKGTQTEPYVAR